MNGGQTPADVELMIDASDAAIRSGLKRHDVYPMFKGIIEKLTNYPTPENGKLITECYDLQKHKPSSDYKSLITKVKVEYKDCGLKWD
jgi:hypothetical protein